MIRMTEAGKKWYAAITIMLEKYRLSHPHDHRSDCDILESMHDHFYKAGLIKKDENTGKYIIPDIIDWNSKNNPFLD